MAGLDMIGDLLHSLAAAGAIALACFGLGRPLFRLLHLPEEESSAVAAWSITLGLILAGVVFLGFASVNLLNEWTVSLVTFLGLMWTTVEIACLVAARGSGCRLLPNSPISVVGFHNGRAMALLMTFAAVVLLGTLLQALTPPLSSDVLSRALAVPKNLISGQGILTQPDAQMSVNLAQMWSCWALLLDGPVAANLLNWGLGILVALSAFVLAKPLLGRGLAQVTALLVVVSPGLYLQMPVSHEAVPLALVMTLAIAAIRQDMESKQPNHILLAAGGLLGAGIAIAPIGIGLGGVLIGWFVLLCRQSDRNRDETIEGVLQLLLAAALVAIPWRIVFPDSSQPPASGPWYETLLQLAMQLGPATIIALGGLAFARRLRGLDSIATVTLLMSLVVLACQAGGMLTLLPLVCLAGSWGWHEAQRLPRRAGAVALGVTLAVLAVQTTRLIWATAETASVALGWKSRDSFLAERCGSYRAAALLNQVSRADQRLLLVDTSESLYFACHAQSTDSTAGGEAARSAHTPSQRLAQAARAGFDYLLLAETEDRPVSQVAPAFASNAGLAANKPPSEENLGPLQEVIPILAYRTADDNNRSIRYRLWKLQGPQAALQATLPVEKSTEQPAVSR